MATNSPERELLDLEKQYWCAIQERDIDTVMRLTDDSCILTGAQGVSRIDKKMLERMMTGAPWTLNEFAFAEEPEVHQITDDVAILAYKVHEKLTVDGIPVTVDAADASTWVRRCGQWVCALHNESIAGDPFGRDRKPTS
jgi:ketosteroid isomerase-like protein